MKIIYKIGLIVSAIVFVMAVFSIFNFGLRLGVDFRGGAVSEIEFKNDRPIVADITSFLQVQSGITSVSVSPSEEKSMILRLNDIQEDVHQQLLASIKSKYGDIEEKRFDSVGPVIGNELKSESITAVIILLIVIVLYIAMVFRGMSNVLSPWTLGMATVIALIHDVIITIGVFALLGRYMDVEITAVFVAAALTILGYSVSDTVVVFDRLRENVQRFGAKEDFTLLAHRSIVQTLSRSINTSLTTLIALISIFIFGGSTLKYFTLALIIGIALGTYSSIFIATPIVMWKGKRK